MVFVTVMVEKSGVWEHEQKTELRWGVAGLGGKV